MARILVVEDEVQLADLTAMALREEHHFVDVVHRGDEGLARALEGDFDLILLDWMLPERDGESICRELRLRNLDTPIILLTARDSKDDIVRGIEAGANDYLTKPFSVKELLARVHGLLRDSASRRVGIDEIGKQVMHPDARGERSLRLKNAHGNLLEGAVLFLDVRGYTSLSQTVSLDEGMHLINELFESTVPIIESHGGVIDKFLGDGLMALFGVPVSLGNNTLHAVRAALAIQRHRKHQKTIVRDSSTPHLEIGIGISSGPLIAGNVGSSARYSFTAMGPTVNLAARLCGEAKGGEVLCAPSCASAIDGEFNYERGAPLDLKGYADAISPLEFRPSGALLHA